MYQTAKSGNSGSPRSLHDLGHAAPGVVVVVAHQSALSLHADELEQASGRPRVLGGDHVRCSQDIDRPALCDSREIQQTGMQRKKVRGRKNQARYWGGGGSFVS